MGYPINYSGLDQKIQTALKQIQLYLEQQGSSIDKLINKINSKSTGSVVSVNEPLKPINNLMSYDINNSLSAYQGRIIKNMFNIMKSPTGFKDPQSITVTYDSTLGTITLTGTVEAYWNGIQIPILRSGWVSASHGVTVGDYRNWYLYYNGSAFVWSKSIWSFEMLQIAFVKFTAANKFGQRECHGVMEPSCHEDFHYNIGTTKVSGGTISGVVIGSITAANRQPLISAMIVEDEDLRSTITALTVASYTQHSLSSVNTGTYTLSQADIVHITSGNNPDYNFWDGAAWIQKPMANNTYMCVWILVIPTTNDAVSLPYRYIFVQGQTNGTLASETARQPTELNLGDLIIESPEYVFVNKIIIQFTSNNWKIVSVLNISGSKWSQVASPAGSFLSSVSVTAPITGDGTLSSPVGFDLTSPLAISNTIQGTQLISTIATGTKPLDITSTTLCDNLNADQLDGVEGTGYINTTSATQTKIGKLGIGSVPTAIYGTNPLFGGVIPKLNIQFDVPAGTYTELVNIRGGMGDGSAVLRRVGLQLNISGEDNLNESLKAGSIILESSNQWVNAPIFSLCTNAIKRLNILQTGEIGIGTETPSTALHIAGAGSAITIGSDSAIKSSGTNPFSLQIGAVNDSDTNRHVQIGAWTSFPAGNFSPKLDINTYTGFVGIGTETPRNKLEIDSGKISGIVDVLRIKNGADDLVSGPAILFSHSYSPDDWQHARIHSISVGYGLGYKADLCFQTNTGANGITSVTEKMRITSEGNIGIGTATPVAKLSINGGCHIGGDSDPGDNNLLVDGAFGCNGKTVQSAYASGGALNSYSTGTYGFDSDANASALHAMVVSIRAALVANGIMS